MKCGLDLSETQSLSHIGDALLEVLLPLSYGSCQNVKVLYCNLSNECVYVS